MKKKAKTYCVCDKADPNVCQFCEQYHQLKPDRIFNHEAWTWKNKTFKRVKE